jgi:hypothetical protein
VARGGDPRVVSVPLVLAAYVLSFVLPVVLPGAGWVLLHRVVAGGLLAFVLFGGEPEPGGPARALSAAVYVLFWLVTLSGLVARWALPARGAGKPVRRAATILAGLALPPIVLLAVAALT